MGNYKHYDEMSSKYAESVTIRNETIKNCDMDFLDKIKAVKYLTDDMILSIDQVAYYYETSRDTISTLIKRHRDEYENDGMVILKGQELKEFKEKYLSQSSSNEPDLNYQKIGSLTLLTKASLLRTGMILTNNTMAVRIRQYLIDSERQLSELQRDWAIQRQIGIIQRNRMTTVLAKFIPDSKNKKFAYPNYTNMIYKCLFNRTAKEMRDEKGLETNDALRDTFNETDLERVRDAEEIVTALVSLGFTYFQIKEQLERKYIKAIE